MSVEQAKRYIDSALTLNTINVVGFSGGEPLLYLDEICELSQYITSRGIRAVGVSTNGFWASTVDRTREVLTKLHLSGIRKLNLSADDFHQEFIPIDNLKNILDLAPEFNFTIDVSVMLAKGTSRLLDVLANLGNNTSYITFSEYRAQPVAQVLNNNIDVIKNKLSIDETSTCNMLNALAIFPNGEVYPCCSHFCDNELLRIGNMNTDSIEEIRKKYNSNMVIRILRKHGFKWFVDKHPSFDVECVNLCDLCDKILHDKDKFYEIFGSHIEDEKQRIYEAYLTQQRVQSQAV